MATDRKLGRLPSIGINSLGELMFYVPLRYKDYTRPAGNLEEALNKGRVYLQLVVLNMTSYNKSRQKIHAKSRDNKAIRLSIEVKDSHGKMGHVSVFGNVWPWKDIVPGDKVFVSGEVGWWSGKLSMKNVELINESMRGRIIPVYRQKPRTITSATIANFVHQALHSNGVREAVEILENEFGMSENEIMGNAKTGYQSLGSLLEDLHEPRTMQSANHARDAAQLISALLVVHQGRRVMARTDDPDSVIKVDRAKLKEYADRLPFALTDDQRTTVKDVCRDLESLKPMRRLISGDVGTGKTLAFLLPALAARAAGARVAVFLPNSMVVRQLGETIREYFPDEEFEVVTADQKPANGLAKNSLLIGTSAILNWSSRWKWKPDLVVVDEQHKHSREMREMMLAPHTNLLEATGTAVPRSVALISHGGMDVSILSQCPVEKSIETRIIGAAEEPRLVEFVKKVIERKGQVGVVCARVEKSEEGIRSIETELPRWQKVFGPRLGVIHGRMENKDKYEAAEKMKKRELDGLLASTAIELGITLPSLRTVIIVNPELHGMSTLHQLRGRAVRGGGKGHCFLFSPEEITDEQRLRLEAVAKCNDGFRLAEEDMRIRGFGDLSEDSELQNGATGLLFNGLAITADDLLTVA